MRVRYDETGRTRCRMRLCGLMCVIGSIVALSIGIHHIVECRKQKNEAAVILGGGSTPA